MDDENVLLLSLITPPASKSLHVRRAWDAQWERVLQDSYGGGEPFILVRAILTLGQNGSADFVKMSQEFVVRNQLIFQKDFAQKVAPLFAQGHRFRLLWTSMKFAEPEELILEGICRAFEDMSMMNMRVCCPDSTARYLASRSGQVFLDMVKTLVPNDVGAPRSQPIRFTNADVDRLCKVLEVSAEEMRRIHVWRAEFIGRVLWQTLRAFVCRFLCLFGFESN
jgi:hypothetical protein